MEKRGQIEKETMYWILSIIGFLVIAFFLYRLFDAISYEERSCELSVITRATSIDAAKQYVPLQCTTRKICLREKGDCSESFAGEKKQVVNLGSDAGKAREIMEKTLAEEMYQCWKLMGEGKRDIVTSLSTKTGFKEASSACVLCARVALDREQAEIILENINLSKYLTSHQAPGSSLTYLQAFTDKSASSYARVGTANEVYREQSSDKRPVGIVELEGNEPESAVLFMQIKPPNYQEAFGNIFKSGGIIAGTAYFLFPRSVASIAVSGASRAIRNPVASAVVLGGTAAWQASIVIMNVHAGRAAAAGKCDRITVPGGESENIAGSGGCSTVVVLPYKANAINELCDYIESKP